MNHRIINFIRALEEVRLRDASFKRIRTNLSAYADLHPAHGGADSVSILSPFVAFFSAPRTLYAGALVLLVMVGTGTVSASAEKAVPGDALYSVKVNVNEKVAQTFADTPKEKAELSVSLATRRADEALVLFAEGKLDDTTAQLLAAEVAAHVEESNAAADAIASAGDFAGSLAVRTELEEELSARVATIEAQTMPVPEAAPDAFGTAEATTMRMLADDAAPAAKSMAAPVEEDPGMRLALGLRANLARVIEARTEATATLLPGVRDGIDLTPLLGETEVPVAAKIPEPAADVAATALVEATTTLEVRAKYVPPSSNAWTPEGDERTFWLPGN